MDIAKYIGLFLVKNRYCYLPNLGEFTVNKRSAKYVDGQLQAPEFDVEFKFSGGLIDDAFANFVANNERISIASAANGIKDFSVATRQTLAEGGEVVIPSFGKFVMNGGQKSFVADPNIQVQEQSIPIFKINTEPTVSTVEGETISQLHERMQLKEPATNDEIVIKPPKVNWSKIVILVLLIAAIIGAIGGIIWYINDSKTVEVTIPEEVDIPEMQTSTADSTQSLKPTDSNTNNPNVTTPAPAAVPQGSTMFGILTFSDKAAAERKEKQLKSYGHNVSVRQNPDSSYVLTITLPGVNDTTVAKDSLRRFFNPKGNVNIIK